MRTWLRIGKLQLSVFILLCLCIAQERNQQTYSQTNFNFIVLGDPQPEEPPLEQPKVFKQILKEISVLNPDGVLFLGDLIRGFTNDTVLLSAQWNSFESSVNSLQAIKMIVPGNHDVWDEKSENEFIHRIGYLYKSFDFGQVHFIILDCYKIGEFNKITGKQLEWLKDDLQSHKNAKHIFIGVHSALWAYGEHSNWMKEVHPLIKQYNVRAVFAGHWHIFQLSDVLDGIRYYISGGAGGMQSEQCIATGEFHHYIHLAIRDSMVSYSVVKPGSIFAGDFISKERSAFVYKIRDDCISDIRMEFDNSVVVSSAVKLEINNTLDFPLKGKVFWKLEQSRFYINPPDLSFNLTPGKTNTFRFTFENKQRLTLEDIIAASPHIEFTFEGNDSINNLSFSKELIAKRIATLSRLTKKVLIDGELKEWNIDFPIRLETRHQVTLERERWKGINETSGKFIASYNDSMLLIAGIINDSNLIHSARKEEPYQGDAVSIFLDLRTGNEFQKKMYYKDVYLLVFAPQSDKGETPYYITVSPFGKMIPAQYASKRLKNGYSVEIGIPLSAIKLNPENRDRIGFDISIDNLQSNGNRTRMVWNGIWANFMYANRYGILELHKNKK